MSKFRMPFGLLRIFVLCVCLLAGAVYAEIIEGHVIRVADGDTLTLMSGGKQYKIRFNAIDAPESTQEFGGESKAFLTKLVLNRRVRVDVEKQDRYGRHVGTVYLDGKDLNLIMLQKGMAWHYKYYNDNPDYAAAEEQAQRAKRGLWRLSHAMAPWDYRRMQREGGGHGDDTDKAQKKTEHHDIHQHKKPKNNKHRQAFGRRLL